jgi:biopolymer transport protein ExbD
MARRKRKSTGGPEGVNMTPMIDIVFQMIIFFVCTVQLEKDAVNEKIRLAMAPHGPEVMKKDPFSVTIDVDDAGKISVARVAMSPATLHAVLRKTVSDYGHMVPVVVRGDAKARHADIKAVMDSCTRAGIWKIKFAAIKDKQS